MAAKKKTGTKKRSTKKSAAKKKTGARKTPAKKKTGARKTPAKKSAAKKKTGSPRKASKRYGAKAQEKVGSAMHELKRGALKSGRSGRTVKSRKQAIAIGLSEARAAGGKVPSGPRKKSAKRR